MVQIVEPVSGSIRLDKIDAQNIDSFHLRKNIAYINGSNLLFQGTIKENITCGREVDDEIIENAIRVAKADDFVNQYGLNFNIGINGNFLSGSQRQRLGLARALALSPKVLLVDQALSLLDEKTELNIFRSIAACNCMTIFAVSSNYKLLSIELG